MSKVTGYFLKLNIDRYELFNNNYATQFAEPVSDFNHPRNVPLICFIFDNDHITHIGFAKRGIRAGTNLRRLNILDIFKLDIPVHTESILQEVNPRSLNYLTNKIVSGGILTSKSFNTFLNVFIKKAKETESMLNKYSQERQKRIELLDEPIKNALAQQQEAVLTAMNIAGIEKEQALGWDNSGKERVPSYLDGINSTRLREDSLIINDLTTIPGFDLIRNSKFSSTVFKNGNTQLTVLLANRLPLEELLGTDLIYFNEDTECFIMVQYKMMEKEDSKFLFRLPNTQFSEEITRMDTISSMLDTIKNDKEVLNFRISNHPFFIKFCPRIEFNPDDMSLSSGMYIPLEYLKLLENDQSTLGPKGGRSISFDNIGRYFNNTTFKTIIEGGWIGTHKNQSNVLREIIKDILENGKTAVVAIKKKIIENKSSIYDDLI